MSINLSKNTNIHTNKKCRWCPGCGNVPILYMLQRALTELDIPLEKIVIVYDVGCHSKGAELTKVYSFYGLHGRALPIAQGIKLVNPDLKVIVMSGDGGGLGLGIGHLIHVCRRNIDITYILHDNQLYGLTTGQASARTEKGVKTKTTPDGNLEDPIHPIKLLHSVGCSYIARAFSGHPHHLLETLKDAIQHKGFSFVDVLQPCITFNKHNTYGWFNERIKIIKDENNLHNIYTSDNLEEITLGVFWRENKPCLEDEIGIGKVASDEIPQTPDMNKIIQYYMV